MKRRLWRVRELNPLVHNIAKKYSISIFLAQVFLNRDIKEDDFCSFLNSVPANFHSPFLLPDIEKAVKRINGAVKLKEKVLVFGDYDVDGITSLAIFYEFAKKTEEIFSFYIPHRIKEGYGLNREAIIRAKENGVSLVIAFDCGTNSYDEIELARSLNIDIIVVDHHHPKDNLTKSLAFINPKRKDSSYPFFDLSAAALSFKLLQALTNSNCRDMLDLVVLSLICDVAPLRGENRVLVKEGLKIIRKSRRPAIKALCKAGGIRQENIDTFHIGYILGPRINASGRIAHANHSLELFLTEDEDKAYNIASTLSKYNQLRKDIEKRILEEAEQRIENNISNDYAIVVSGDKWHPGVLGIVASRLADKYYRPSFVISFDQDNGVGSARSIASLHLIEILDKCADSLLLYGGHRKAAGMQIDKAKLDNFREKINFHIEKNSDSKDFIPFFDIDVKLNFEDIEMNFIESLEKMKPHGEGNSRPLFTACGIFKKSAPKKIKSGFSVWLSGETKVFEGVVYDRDVLEIINYSDNFDIVFSLEKNNYHNTPRLIIRDCRLSAG